MQIKTAFVLITAVGSSAFVWGCGAGFAPESTGTNRANLHRAKGCTDLLADFKADASFKINESIDLQIASTRKCVETRGDANCAYGGGYYGSGTDGASNGAGTDGGGSGAPAPRSPGESATSHSETNTQVKGVDEADIVKNDGKYLYVLHGNVFKVVQAWPANELRESSSFEIEGTPREMFVADGKVVVYSQVNGVGVLAAAGITAKSQYRDYVYYPFGGFGGGDMSGGVTRPPGGGTPQPYVPLTKVTVLNLQGTAASLAREMYFEGDYLDARRVGPSVRTVLSSHGYGPQLKYSVYQLFPTVQNGNGANPYYPKSGSEMIAALEKLRSENLASVGASTLQDWLPNTFVKKGAAVQAHTVACTDFYVPTVGSTLSGITEVTSLDLNDAESAPNETAILGRSETVYGSKDSLYVTASAWTNYPMIWDAGPMTTGAEPVGVTARTMGKTHIHKFEFQSDAKFPNYVASGTVPGVVKNQFSLDEKDGHLRIATTETRIYLDAAGRYVPSSGVTSTEPSAPPPRPNTVNNVAVLTQKGGWLDAIGEVNGLAPNERIFSVRFVGDRGYVVTFRQVDPLFVLDLSQPKQPAVLAALKIPGFSEYMHPLDANHILTIGRDATSEGRVRNLQLQIFDVTNGANPVLKHKFTYDGSEYGSSEASYDHKAFTYFADRKLLAFPYMSYGGSNGHKSTLELFKIDVAAGFTKVGSIDHSALVPSNPQGYCGGYYQPNVRRGVFLDNIVYSVSYGGVVAKNADDLAGPSHQLAFPTPQINPGYGPACYVAR